VRVTVRGTPVARERRHTLYFLAGIRDFAPVFLDTEIDMSRVRAHRADARADGLHYALVSYVVHAAARVLAWHPQANAAIVGRRRPRVAEYQDVSGKLTFDKVVGGRRVVLSAVLPALQSADLGEIQSQVDHFRDGDPDVMQEFAAVRLLHRLPQPLGRALARIGTRGLGSRPVRMGTFAVTSLGHRAVDGFQSVGGTTLTFGVGRMLDRPAVRDGEVVVAPLLRLNLAFDHRVVDGAEAADILTEVKDALEAFPGWSGDEQHRRVETVRDRARESAEHPASPL
jgi:2-oxoacid dehydrogenases acyltransferase (catalytic domain)